MPEPQQRDDAERRATAEAAAVGERLRSFGPLSMLAGLQVMLGLALALGVLHLIDLSRTAGGIATGDWLFADVVFMCIASVCYYYLLLGVVLPVPPSINQMMIPLTIGGATMALARTFDQPAIFLPIYLLYLVASCVGFAYTGWHNTRNPLLGPAGPLRDALGRECRKNMLCLAAMAAGTLLVWGGYPAGERSGWRDGVFIAINGAAFLWMMWQTESTFARDVRASARESRAAPDHRPR